MQAIIERKLDCVEQERNVHILYAVESGSRAWGFASPDSDFDVRFIYVRPLQDYLRLEYTSDVIEYELNEEMDIVGWDLQKALRLAHKSNPSLFEWLGSPIVYRTTDAFQRIRPLLTTYYNKKHGLYHYRSMAKKNYHTNFKHDHVKLKQYFYVLRPLLACKWILHHVTPPPVLFDDLVKSELEPSLLPKMATLLEMKSRHNESDEHIKIALWDTWIKENLIQLEGSAENINTEERIPWENLNEAFRSIIDVH
jgi:predicted nucleotidyltransferase